MSDLRVTLLIDDRKYGAVLDMEENEHGGYTEAQVDSVGDMLRDTVRYHFGLILNEVFE